MLNAFTAKVNKELSQQYLSKESDIQYLSAMKTFLKDFFQTGKQSFEYKCILFGSESLLPLNIVTIMEFLSGYYSSRQACFFLKNQNKDSFYSMIQAYALNAQLFLQGQELNVFAKSYFESDIALTALFSAFFLPKTLVPVTEHLLRFLEDEKKQSLGYSRPRLGNYGRNNLLVLLGEILKHFNQIELSSSIARFYTKETTLAFRNAIKSAQAEDTGTFNNCISELLLFHINSSKSSDHTAPLHSPHWQFFPVEIIVLYFVRASCGLALQPCTFSFINQFLPFIAYPYTMQPDDPGQLFIQ